MKNLKRIWLAQQAVWRAKANGRLSMPLAAGCLKAVVEADVSLRGETDVRIFNFSGADSTMSVINGMFLEELPDIVGFSILGWNYHLFGRVSETYRQLNREGWVIWGGTHAANQAHRAFGTYPAVDIIVNGEGELTFVEIIRAYLAGKSRYELHDIPGISFKTAAGEIITTSACPRITDLDSIPSPILTGAIPLTNRSGQFLYDYALMETNRGCPYACAFCYWGGAIGQRMRSFSIERLSEEITYLARRGVETVCLCDSNFGMLKADEEFLEICVKAREQYGFPKNIVTSWAKNKSQTFFRIVRRMKETGFHASFNLALQSLSDPVLLQMGRKNMKVNDWKDLAKWLENEGMDLYAELIWGCPGETYESFLEGYDSLAEHVTRIATYPHLMLPNTTYTEKKEEFGIVTWRSDEHDFELVLSHDNMTLADNRKMHRFLFWSRVFVEHLVLRHIWLPLRRLCGLTQSQILLSIDRWFDQQSDPTSMNLLALRNSVVEALEPGSKQIEDALEFVYTQPALDLLMETWWREEILPQVNLSFRAFFLDLFRFDWITRPLYKYETRPNHNANNKGAGTSRRHPEVRVVEMGGEHYYARENVSFSYDVPAMLRKLKKGTECDFAPSPVNSTFYYKTGFCNDMSLYHNAHNKVFFGTPDIPTR